MSKIKLGDKAKDKISGFEGIVTAEVKFLNGCDRLQITPDKLNTDGSLIDGEYFDRPQLQRVKEKKIKVEKNNNGGDRPDPKGYKLP